MPSFNFDLIADAYDSYYETFLGKQLDHVEKQMIWKYMTRMERGAFLTGFVKKTKS